jgi:4-diphosphocytidyl-2-C-methyl-D-erythritol kinase
VFTRDEVQIKAFGKVNLSLKIIGIRDDGLHELETLMLRVSCHDQVVVKKVPQGLHLHCSGLEQVSETDNLAYKAAKALLDRVGSNLGLEIFIDKNIPVGAGMGGGSSDAAATLIAVNHLIGNQAVSFNTLKEIASTIGADVPFFVGADAYPARWKGALCTGIGEIIEPVLVPSLYLVVAVPKFAVNTAWAYSQYDATTHEKNEFEATCELTPLTRRVLQALCDGDLERVSQCIFNDLEKAVVQKYPDIQAIKEGLLESSALGAMMTGSGSAVFGICRSREHAQVVYDSFLGAYDSLVKHLFVTDTEGVLF